MVIKFLCAPNERIFLLINRWAIATNYQTCNFSSPKFIKFYKMKNKNERLYFVCLYFHLKIKNQFLFLIIQELSYSITNRIDRNVCYIYILLNHNTYKCFWQTPTATTTTIKQYLFLDVPFPFTRINVTKIIRYFFCFFFLFYHFLRYGFRIDVPNSVNKNV